MKRTIEQWSGCKPESMATGMRAPNDGVAYEAAREFIVKECSK